MSKLPELPMYTFTVTTLSIDNLKGEDVTVEAAYFQESGKYTVLKDDGHLAVDAFRTDTVLRLKRSEEPVDFG